jgi:hypothetical protein
MGSSNEQHSSNKTEGRVIHSPERILADFMGDFMTSNDRNRALEALVKCVRVAQ